ncbi:hypothetical protein KY343_01015 [Candidatus Woesearchaeota archaeon]|nr:hypothetical protein [Candidatus Woesearchaeota archaeon]
MKKIILLLFILIISLLILTGCKKEAPEEPTPPSPPGMSQPDNIIENIFYDDISAKPKPLYITNINL